MEIYASHDFVKPSAVIHTYTATVTSINSGVIQYPADRMLYLTLVPQIPLIKLIGNCKKPFYNIIITTSKKGEVFLFSLVLFWFLCLLFFFFFLFLVFLRLKIKQISQICINSLLITLSNHNNNLLDQNKTIFTILSHLFLNRTSIWKKDIRINVYEDWLKCSYVDKDILMECDQMRFILQISPPCRPCTFSISVALHGSHWFKKSTVDMT